MAAANDSKLWHKQSNPDTAASIAHRIASVQRGRNQPRIERSRKHASMYEGLELAGLDGDVWEDLEIATFDGAPLLHNTCEEINDTLRAKLAALDEPRPQYVVTDGTYDQRRQAIWLDRFVEGIYYQKQGQFSTLWDLWRHAFLIAAAATGSVAVKIFPDFTARKIVCECHSTLDMWVDSAECRYGMPLTYGEDTWMDREYLLDTYSRSQKKTQAILMAAEQPPKSEGKNDQSDRLQVRVHELWRVKDRPDKDGTYLRAVGDCALEWDDWKYSTPPYAFYHYKRRMGGFWGKSATESFYHSVVREQQVLNRMDEAEARSHTIVVPYDPNVMGSNQLTATPKHVVYQPYDSTKGPPPQPFVVPWYPQTAPELMNIHRGNAHGVVGVNQMQTQGQIQTGLTAAVAIRTALSLVNERLAPQQRDIVQAMAVDSASLIARAGKELYDRFGEFDSAWYGKGFVKKLPGKDCLALPAEIFTIQPRPVSDKKNSPQDRIQLADELVKQGIITGGHWLGTLRHMDTVAAMQQFGKVEEWCEKLFDSFRNAPDSDLRKPGFYLSPPKYMDLDYAMALAVDALLSAQIDDVPDERRQLFLKFLGDLDRKITQRDQQRLANGLPPKGAPGQPMQQPPPSVGNDVAA